MITCLDSAFDIYVKNVENLTLPYRLSRCPTSTLHAINDLLNLAFPNSNAYDFVTRTMRYEYDDLYLPYLEKLEISIEKSRVYKPVEMLLSPINGMGERGRPNTWRQIILSLSHRNFAAPNILSDHDPKKTATRLFDKFVAVLNVEKLNELVDGVLPDINKMNRWLLSRDLGKCKQILNDFDFSTISEKFRTMTLMVKSDLKPKLDTSHFSKYSPPANIVYYKSIINMYFSPIFLEIFSRIVYCLDSKIILMSGMNNIELGNNIKSILPGGFKDMYFLELDISKFDKSQGVIIKLFEEMVYKLFKFSDDIYENIKLTEYFARCISRSGVKVDLAAQRRTGSPNTWLSNTIVTLSIILTYYDISDIDLLLVSGDDSLIVSKRPLENRCNEISKDLGMDIKLLQHPVPYFCSKFLVDDSDSFRVCPDPIRFFEKLSNPIFPASLNDGVLRERFISFKDLLGCYENHRIIELIMPLIERKYYLPKDSCYASLCYIHSLLSNFSNFSRLYLDSNKIVI